MFASNEPRILGQDGFDPGREILAITVNRWPHGYAYEYSTLWDSAILESGEQPSDRAQTLQTNFDCEYRRRSARFFEGRHRPLT